MPGRLHAGSDSCSSLSRAVRFCGWSLDRPLERPNPAAEFVLGGREDHETRRSPLQELAAELFEPFLDDLLVSHVADNDDRARYSFDERDK